MQTVNFRCGHCGNLMAVVTTHLGQQVRCPHCQQVVMAPAFAGPTPAAPPPPPPPMPDLNLQENSFSVPKPDREQDSIFAPPDEADEDLFGEAPAPRLEIPQDPIWPQAPMQPPAEPSTMPLQPTPFDPGPAAAPLGEQTATWLQPEPPAQQVALEPTVSVPPAVEGLTPSSETAVSEPDVLAEVSRPVRPIQRGNPWLVPLLILPLVSYSILVTILLAMAYLKQPPPHPLEMMRDDDGINPPARRTGKERVQRIHPWGIRPKLDVPPKLRVKLGESLILGDRLIGDQLQVKPLAAELRKVMIYTEGFPRPDPSPAETLVLHLELKNVSSDVAFYPLDSYFNRRFSSKFEENVPFTYLEKGNKRFYGGAAKFRTKRDPGESLELYGVDDDLDKKLPQHTEKELMPGEKFRTFVACNADDSEVAEALANYDGPLLYRIRLRRGLVTFKEQEVSASVVVGVEFTGKDVMRRPG